jgi:hypothetical protein
VCREAWGVHPRLRCRRRVVPQRPRGIHCSYYKMMMNWGFSTVCNLSVELQICFMQAHFGFWGIWPDANLQVMLFALFSSFLFLEKIWWVILPVISIIKPLYVILQIHCATTPWGSEMWYETLIEDWSKNADWRTYQVVCVYCFQ